MSAPVLDRAGVLARIPHQGAMCLWDEVVAWDARRIRVRAWNHACRIATQRCPRRES